MVMYSTNVQRSWFLGNLVGRIKAAVARRRELSGLSRREIDEISHELNLSSAEFRALSEQDAGSSALLTKRLASSGLSEQALVTEHADVVRDLQRVCGLCGEKRRCASDLASEADALSRYCPNEMTLSALTAKPADKTRG